jgi:hypothetical protein
VNINNKERMLRGDGKIVIVMDKKREIDKKIKKVEKRLGY